MADEGQRFSGPALGSIAAGGLLVFAGIKGYSLSTALQDILKGSSPLKETIANPITGAPASGYPGADNPGGSAPIGTQTASGLANIAIGYEGKIHYCYGGALNAPSMGCPAGTLDCSSFANLCASQAGLPIPGYPAGSWNNASHGPDTIAWLGWTGLTTVGHNGNVAQAGDLAIWQTHMGICLGSNSMVSAQNPANGAQQSSINGFIPGEILFVRRYKSQSEVPSG